MHAQRTMVRWATTQGFQHSIMTPNTLKIHRKDIMFFPCISNKNTLKIQKFHIFPRKYQTITGWMNCFIFHSQYQILCSFWLWVFQTWLGLVLYFIAKIQNFCICWVFFWQIHRKNIVYLLCILHVFCFKIQCQKPCVWHCLGNHYSDCTTLEFAKCVLFLARISHWKNWR